MTPLTPADYDRIASQKDCTYREAHAIILDYQKWRRAEPPYDGEAPDNYEPFDFDHKSRALGIAFDKALASLEYIYLFAEPDNK